MQEVWPRRMARVVAEKLDVDAAMLRHFFLASHGHSPKVLEVACFEIANANDDRAIILVLKCADGTVITKYPEGPIHGSRTLWTLHYPTDSIDLTILPETGWVRLVFRECGIECRVPISKRYVCKSLFFELARYFLVISIPIFLSALVARLRTGEV